jgi:hypothetical protein
VSNRSAFPSVQTSDDARTKVSDLRRPIESREAELIHKKEALARNDATGVTAAHIELNRLQSAFEQVPKLADSKLRPVFDIFQQTQARYGSRKLRMKMFHRVAKEGDGSLKFMQQRIDQGAADLESPDVPEAADSALLALVRDSQRLLNDLQIVHCTKELGLGTERAFAQINDLPTKQLLGSRDHQARE